MLEADAIFIGANAVDYSGYPDCRPEYLQAFESMANLATKRGRRGRADRIVAPHGADDQGGDRAGGHELGVDFALTVSCYQADEAGRACGRVRFVPHAPRGL